MRCSVSTRRWIALAASLTLSGLLGCALVPVRLLIPAPPRADYRVLDEIDSASGGAWMCPASREYILEVDAYFDGIDAMRAE